MGAIGSVTAIIAIIIIIIILISMYRYRLRTVSFQHVQGGRGRLSGWLTNGAYVNYYMT